MQLQTDFGVLPIRRWIANSASKLLALRLSTIHWINGDKKLLPPPLLSTELPDERGHVVFYTKTDAARLSLQLSAVVETHMTLCAIIELLISNCTGPILAIAGDDNRKLCARARVDCRLFMRALIEGATLRHFIRSSQVTII